MGGGQEGAPLPPSHSLSQQQLLAQGGRSGLHVASAAGQTEVVAALLQARWDPNATDKVGCTAIVRAAAGGHVNVVKLLIQHGADVNAQDKQHGNTALHEASWRGYSECVHALSRAPGVRLDVRNLGGFAPLHLACQNGHNQSCRELLLACANPDVTNNYGDTPLHTSARYGHAGVTRILISAECKRSIQNKNGDTALHITAAMGRRKLTRILIEAGCHPSLRNKQGERAKDIAIRKGLNEIIDIMEKTVALRKKRDKGSNGSGGRKEKKQKEPKQPVAGEAEGGWSPYGCHYFPDASTFPQPRLNSLPPEPLRSGEQYYLDLAGNIRKGPVGVGYTCYCAPFFRHMEARLDRDKKELKAHIDAAHGRLDKKVSNLEVTTRGQLAAMARSAAMERAKCQQRHLHLEQWLLRGTLLKPTKLSKARSLESVLEPKQSSSPEGKESGKGSSEVVGPGSESEDEDATETVRPSTLAMSERIDGLLQGGTHGSQTPQSMEMLYGDLLQWREQHTKESRPSVHDIVSKFQKKQTMQELVAKIHKKTDKIHKSAQKWKEKQQEHVESDSSGEEDVEEELNTALRRLPFRCRDTVYSPDPPEVPPLPPDPLHYHSAMSALSALRMNDTECRPGQYTQPADSPQADSGYSAKLWAPSPSPTGLAGGRSRMADSMKPPVPVRSIHPGTASLV